MPQTASVQAKRIPKTPETAITIRTVPRAEDEQATQKAPWLPITLRLSYLYALIAITLLLLIAVQWLYWISERNKGVLFAQNINKLPLSHSFSYLYLPTVLSVIYSFLWTWMDLDIKRLEPYFQLSKAGGTAASNSMLLSYPLEFLVTIPLVAFRRKHWQVLSGSAVMILIFWGLTPAQSGIFAVRTVNIEKEVLGSYATTFIPITKQGNVSSTYAQSVYNIAWLNESLPPFMTEDYVLGAFGPSEQAPAVAVNTTYTGLTNMYSVDLQCEEATLWNNSGVWYYNSTGGCSFYAPDYRPSGGNDTSKPYDTMYAGYQNQDGFASYYLSSSCAEDFLHLFFIRWSKSRPEAISSGNATNGSLNPADADSTSLFCQASYFQQLVNATISSPSQSVLDIVSVGEKTQLPADLFNVSTFEWAMNSGQSQTRDRNDYPVASFPNQQSQLSKLPLNLAYLPKIAPFAIATDQRPLYEYLDHETLRLSYQAAYRLLFARQLVDILGRDLDNGTANAGHMRYVTQAVVVVPAFAYTATALLAVVLILACGLAVVAPRRSNKMEADPATLGALMDLMPADVGTINTFADVTDYTADKLASTLSDTKFSFQELSERQSGQTCLRRHCETSQAIDSWSRSSQNSPAQPGTGSAGPSAGVRPFEMKIMIGIVFFAVQAAACITFAVLYCQAKAQRGLPLPSKSDFVRQLVENYIPVALATLIEPFWLVLNRLLSLLQPFEELRKRQVTSAKSVDLDYSSLPPHVLFGRAFRAGHILLGIVCFMTLLANVLSVALSGLIYEGQMNVTHTVNLTKVQESRVANLNGTAFPLDSNAAGITQVDATGEVFYRLMSNLTAGTPLPAWTDETYAYMAVDLSSLNANATVEIETTAFRGDLDCARLPDTRTNNTYALTYNNDAAEAHVTVSIAHEDGHLVNCTNSRPWTRSDAPPGSSYIANSESGRSAVELNAYLSSSKTAPKDNLFCMQHILVGWIRADFEIIEGAKRTYRGLPQMRATSSNETMLLCRPKIVIERVTIEVDACGQVHRRINNGSQVLETDSYYSTSQADLIGQANQYLVDSDATWHKDAYPSDFLNYLIGKAYNYTSMFDASQPVPAAEPISAHLRDLYGRLFAIWISTNADKIFENNTNGTTSPAKVSLPETRILFSTPAFIVTEVILVCYMLTTIAFYAKRPWRILPRLPATMASNIAFFAASRALFELAARREAGDVRSGKEVRESWTWGYGKFVGVDGKDHVGVERDPLVGVLRKSDLRKIRVKFEED